MTPSDITAAPGEPIPLRGERSRRIIVALLVVVAVVLVALAVVALAGQAFGPDPMTGT